MADINELKKKYEGYKSDKTKYEKELYLKESKESECIAKILSNVEDLVKLGIKDIIIDKEKLSDKEYLVDLTERIIKLYDNYLTEVDNLLKDR